MSALIPAVGGRSGSPEQILGLAAAAGFLWCAVVTARNPSIQAGVGMAVAVIALTYLAAELGIVLFTRAALAGGSPDVAAATSWAPVLLIAGWVLFDAGANLRAIVIAYYAALAAPEVVFGIVRGPAALVGTLNVTGPLLLASLAATVLLAEAARLRDQFAASRAAQHVMETMALTDPLTELPNRRSLMMELTREIALAARFGLPLAVIEFDLDNFKEINDVYGHQAGDRVLVAVASSTQRRLRATDFVGRLGGEEFLILAPGTALPEATRLADELRLSLHGRPMARDRAWVTASFGVTVYERGDTPETMFARADAALYSAKRGGRNRVEPAPARSAAAQAVEREGGRD
ncbi:MAG TPA: GGDEF domain-containing protein [bacterium]|nr:GGDEF domain-containing protein [bacterium]